MAKLPWDYETGHERVWGLFQTNALDHPSSCLCDCISNAICIAVFHSRDDADAFRNLQQAELREARALRTEQQAGTRPLRPYEELVGYIGEFSWEVRPLALDPKSTAEIYKS